MNCRLLRRENYWSGAEAKCIEISIDRTRDPPSQLVRVWVRIRAPSRMCGHKSALQITALLLNGGVATSADALDR